MILVMILTRVARAAPELEMHALLEAGNAETQRALGAGLTVGEALSPVLQLEGVLQGGVTAAGSPRLGLRPELRLQVPRPEPDRGGVSLVVGYGLGLRDGVYPEGAAGVAVELPRRRDLQARLQGRLLLDGVSPAGFQLTLGSVWLRPEPEPQPAPAPVVLAEPTLDVTPPEALIWLPHPICAWMPPAEAARALGSLDPGVEAQVVARGYLPAQVHLEPGGTVALQEAPRQGSLVIAARPGDRVLVDGRPLSLGGDGVAVLNAREGLIRVSATGGGRQVTREAVVSNGLALWVRLPDPAPVVLRFEVGSSRVSAEDRARLQELGRMAGDWGFEVQGSASPEGDQADNLRLADERARAGAALLVAAGVPGARVRVLPALVAPALREGEDPTQHRVATVRAVPAGERP